MSLSQRSQRNSGRLLIAKTSPSSARRGRRQSRKRRQSRSQSQLPGVQTCSIGLPVEETPIYQPTPVASDESPVEVESPVETASAVEVEVEAVSMWQEEVVSEPAIEYIVEPTPIEEVIEPEAPVKP